MLHIICINFLDGNRFRKEISFGSFRVIIFLKLTLSFSFLVIKSNHLTLTLQIKYLLFHSSKCLKKNEREMQNYFLYVVEKFFENNPGGS